MTKTGLYPALARRNLEATQPGCNKPAQTFKIQISTQRNHPQEWLLTLTFPKNPNPDFMLVLGSNIKPSWFYYLSSL